MSATAEKICVDPEMFQPAPVQVLKRVSLHVMSSSNAGAVILCPPRAILPQVREAAGERADRGTCLHEFARVVAVQPERRAEALAAVPEEYRHTAQGMNVALALDGLMVLGCEMAYALNVETKTTRFIGENIGRNYGATSKYEVPFTVDVEAVVDGEGTPVELDYKSGQSIGPVAEHWQRRVCSTGLMLFHGASTAISRVAYIWDDGSIHPDGHEFNAFEAEDFCDEMKKAIDAVHAAEAQLYGGEMPTVHPSDDACKYCPALTSCPAHTNFAKAMLGKLQAIEKGPELSALSPEDMLEAWEIAKKAEKISEAVLKSLKAIAAETPFGDDKYEVRPKMKGGKSFFDAGKARGKIVTLLGRLGASEEEIEKELADLNGKGSDYPEFRKCKVST